MRRIIVVLVALLLWLQYKLWQGPGSIAEVLDLQNQVTQQQQRLQELNERNRVQEAEVIDLKDGLDALEEHARQELGMIRQGEVFYQTIDAPATQTKPEPKHKSTH